MLNYTGNVELNHQKTQLWEATMGWLLLNPSFNGAKHSIGKVIPYTKLGRQETLVNQIESFYTFVIRIPMDELRPHHGYVELWYKQTRNMFPNTKTWENEWSNFSENLRIVALKLLN